MLRDRVRKIIVVLVVIIPITLGEIFCMHSLNMTPRRRKEKSRYSSQHAPLLPGRGSRAGLDALENFLVGIEL
jgi:hypothetical protein